MTEWDLAYMRREVKPAPAAPLTDTDIDRIADAVPVDELEVYTSSWHIRFARALLSAAPAVPDYVATLYDAIAHGDDVHRAWLKAAIGAHFAGLPVPPFVAAPAVREPLSKHKVDELCAQLTMEPYQVRAIEQAHGIGGGGK